MKVGTAIIRTNFSIKYSDSWQINLQQLLKKNGDWWVGWIEEVKGVNAQEATKEELIESLREARQDILELNRS